MKRCVILACLLVCLISFSLIAEQGNFDTDVNLGSHNDITMTWPDEGGFDTDIDLGTHDDITMNWLDENEFDPDPNLERHNDDTCVWDQPFDEYAVLHQHYDCTMTWVGSITSQADAVMNADDARTILGVSGSGIKIGIISDSFDALGGAASGVATFDLPGHPLHPTGNTTPVMVLNDSLVPSSIDEGRAMAELIHDLAPNAELLFHSAFNNGGAGPPDQTIAIAINNLVAAGADIIVDDVAVLTTAVYQDSAASQAYNNAKAAGVACFSSAGNNADNAYQGFYNPLGNVHNFDLNNSEDGDIFLNVEIPSGNSSIVLNWSDPTPSISGPSVVSDYSLQISNGIATLLEADADQAAGADPVEFLGVVNNGAPATLGVLIEANSGASTADLLKVTVYSGVVIADDDDTNSPTIFGHPAAEGSVAVAAAAWFSPDTPETFTSVGPVQILFDSSGSDVNEIRSAPMVTGIDGTSTTFFGTNTGGSFNFFGTSAAAPHVAAVAALVFERAEQLGFSLTVGLAE